MIKNDKDDGIKDLNMIKLLKIIRIQVMKAKIFVHLKL